MEIEVNPAEEDADIGNFSPPALGVLSHPSAHIPSFFLLDANSSAGVP